MVLKYFKGKYIVDTIKRLSSPGRKQYVKVHELPWKEWFGSSGCHNIERCDDHYRKKLGIGGELLAAIY